MKRYGIYTENKGFSFTNYVNYDKIEYMNGEIYTGFCIEGASGVLNLCAERLAAIDMYKHSGQTIIKRMIVFRSTPPNGPDRGMPCGACREFLLQLNEKNKETEIMYNFEKREFYKLGDLVPHWWGYRRYRDSKKIN